MSVLKGVFAGCGSVQGKEGSVQGNVGRKTQMPGGSNVLHFWFWGLVCVPVCVYVYTVRGIWKVSSFTSEIMQARRSEVKYHALRSPVLFRLGTMETLAWPNSSALKCQSCSHTSDNKVTFQSFSQVVDLLQPPNDI